MQTVREVEPVRVSDIYVADRLRHITEDAVETMAASLASIGLLTPITVRVVELMEIDGREVAGVPILVTGATRLAAAKRLGWTMIDTLTADVSEVEARRHEIAENLHRTELTVQERAEHVAEWVRLAEVSTQVGTKPDAGPSKGGRPEGGVRAAARALGLKSSEADRAVKIAGMDTDAKEAVRQAGLDDNQSVLERVARAPKGEQAKVVHSIVEARALKTEQDVRNRAAQYIAEVLAERVPADGWDGLKANLEAAHSVKLILAAFNNLTGPSVMDRRHA